MNTVVNTTIASNGRATVRPVLSVLRPGKFRPAPDRTFRPSGSMADASAGRVAGDAILNQTDTQFDPAGDATLVTSFDSFDDASNAAGALNATDSRASFTAYWHDGVGRQTAEQDFGATASPPAGVPP